MRPLASPHVDACSRCTHRLVLLEAASPGDLMGLYAGELFPQGMSDEIGSQSLESRWGTWKRCVFALSPGGAPR